MGDKILVEMQFESNSEVIVLKKQQPINKKSFNNKL